MEKYKKTLIGFERTDNQPLEKNVVFATSAELTTYLQNDPTKYNGQIVTVKGNGTSSKGTSYRIDQLGSTWKAVPLADSEDVATKAQGTKADSAVQAATIGGTAVTKSGTTLQFPAYPTSLPASDKDAILTAAATDAQNKVNAHNNPTIHITAAERNTWNAAIQSATVGGTAVTKSGTALQFPAYPTSLPASDKATILTEAATTAQSKVDVAIKANVTDKKGALNGLATLDGTGKVPANQLPSYVDDVIDLVGFCELNPTSGMTVGQKWYNQNSMKIAEATSATATKDSNPESDKIYIHTGNNKTYRWSGSSMVVISETIALGETSSTAYSGDKGKTNATNITNLQNGKLDKTGDGSNVTSTFTTAGSRTNIVSGEKLSVMFGKVAKWFGELKALAFKATVGTNDIDDFSVTETKIAPNSITSNMIVSGEISLAELNPSIATVIENTQPMTELAFHIRAATSEVEEQAPTDIISVDLKLLSRIKIEGVKKHAVITVGPANGKSSIPTNLFPHIQDEAGNVITDLFSVRKLDAVTKIYKLLSDVEIGTLYFSSLYE